ncbi:MAG: hypothetical protein HC884_18465 [Chloroflexaceae bacterium]|nr:hypothetical protein [Chloroflexaceae bacterium]
MATPFSNSIRSMQTDGFQGSLIGSVLAMVLLSGWLAWFFLATVTLYEESATMVVSETYTMVAADFPLETQGRIKRGQAALLHFEGAAGTTTGVVPALVVEVETRPEENRVRANLYPFWSADPTEIPPEDLVGTARVEVDHVSPAMLVLQATGQFINTAQIRTSPQDPAIHQGK